MIKRFKNIVKIKKWISLFISPLVIDKEGEIKGTKCEGNKNGNP